VIDSYARLENLLNSYQEIFRQLRNRRHELQEMIRKEEQSRKTRDYQEFLLNELESADIAADEQQELEEQLNVITHAEEIKSHLYQALQILGGEEASVIDLLSETESGLSKIAGYHTEIAQILERISTGLIDLREVNRELSAIDQGIDYNAEAMANLQERLDLIYRLQQKHHVNSCAELVSIREQLNAELSEISSLEDQIIAIGKEITLFEQELTSAARELSVKREESFVPFSEQVSNLLVHMGMPEARFSVVREELNELNTYGRDNIEFFFNANKGHSLKPIADIASGGELSRVMLSIKSLISKKKMLPTIVFDEIDNGLSGDIAGRIGDILIRMSEGIQVIAITHLPQIAGKADQQYTVFKEEKEQVTYSNIRLLDEEGRLVELAKMIGGKDTSAASIAAARELLLPAGGIQRVFDNN
jgi:DNA repair protein RecN (Recombination protein N)